jgi:hypothetical protein
MAKVNNFTASLASINVWGLNRKSKRETFFYGQLKKILMSWFYKILIGPMI